MTYHTASILYASPSMLFTSFDNGSAYCIVDLTNNHARWFDSKAAQALREQLEVYTTQTPTLAPDDAFKAILDATKAATAKQGDTNNVS